MERSAVRRGEASTRVHLGCRYRPQSWRCDSPISPLFFLLLSSYLLSPSLLSCFILWTHFSFFTWINELLFIHLITFVWTPTSGRSFECGVKIVVRSKDGEFWFLNRVHQFKDFPSSHQITKFKLIHIIYF